MSSKLTIRVWQEIDIKEIEPRLLIAGSTSADCGNCKDIGIAFDAITCPQCQAAFKYMGTRLVSSPREAKRLRAKRPDLILIELKDFREAQARTKARGILGE